MGRKDRRGWILFTVSFSFMFLRMPLISFKTANSVLNRNRGLLERPGFPASPTELKMEHTYLHSLWDLLHPEHCGLWKSMLRRHHRCCLCIGKQGMLDTDGAHISSAHTHVQCPIQLQLQNRGSEIKGWRMLDSSSRTFHELGDLWAWSKTDWVAHPRSWPWTLWFLCFISSTH